MANNKNPNDKQPGENPEGKYHYNPGSMAGKTPEDAEQTAENRGELHEHVANSMSTKTSPPIRGNEVAN